MNRPRRTGKASGSRDGRYSTPAWFRLRWHVLKRDPTCKVCGLAPSVILDHIVPAKDDGAFYDPANVQGVCDRCHRFKSRREQGARGELGRVKRTQDYSREVDDEGYPVDPRHPCNWPR